VHKGNHRRGRRGYLKCRNFTVPIRFPLAVQSKRGLGLEYFVGSDPFGDMFWSRAEPDSNGRLVGEAVRDFFDV
jgi:hypothetical protein